MIDICRGPFERVTYITEAPLRCHQNMSVLIRPGAMGRAPATLNNFQITGFDV